MNSHVETLDDITAEQDGFLINLQKIVFAIIILYFFIFLSFNAFFSALTAGIGIFFLAPLTYKLQKDGKKTAAKLLFLTSCNFYVYGASYGLQHSLNFEYFFPAAMMITLLIFNPVETLNIAFGFVIPLLGWALMSWGPDALKLGTLLSEHRLLNAFKAFNFCSSYAIVAVVLTLYIKSLARLQTYSLRTAHASRDSLCNALDVVRASEASLAEAQKIAKLGNWNVNLVTGRVIWSPQMFSIFPRAIAQGAPSLAEFRACIHPDDREAWSKNAQNNQKSAGSYVTQYRVIHPDKVVWVEVRGQTTCEHGAILSIQGTCQDITEQKLVQESLKQVNAWREAVMDASPFAILAADGSGAMTVCNHAAERLLESTKELILSKDALSLFDPSQFRSRVDLNNRSTNGNDAFASRMASLFGNTSNGQFEFKEFTIINAGGKKIPIRLCISYILDTNGTHTGYLYIMEDLTEQKRLLQTIEAQNAQILSSAKMSSLGEMASSIAHEINNPLTIIHARTVQLRRIVDGGHSIADRTKFDQIAEGLSKIEKTAERIAKIIHGLRTFSRNSEQDDLQTVAVSRVIEDTLELCRERFRSNGIDLRLDSFVEVHLHCRSVQISQVLMNLLNNAFDAVEQLNDKWVSIETSTSDHKVTLTITDSGSGIPEAIAEKMMQPFYTTKAIGKGTGLGLGISVGIIHAHGGRLFYDAAAKNTRFVIELPYQNAPANNEDTDPTRVA